MKSGFKTVKVYISFVFISLFLLSLNNIQAENNWQQGYLYGGEMDSFIQGNAVTTDNMGNYYVAGFFDETIFFDAIELNTIGQDDIFLAKINHQGEVVWAVSAGSTARDEVFAIALDSDGNVYITGEYRNTIEFTIDDDLESTGGTDIFIAKYDNDGEFLWAQSAGGFGNDKGVSLAIDGDDNVYVGGDFAMEAHFSITESVTASGSIDYFIAKYSPAGVFQWVQSAGGDISSFANLFGISYYNNKLYVTGRYSGDIDFDESNSLTGDGSLIPFTAVYDVSLGADFDFAVSAELTDEIDYATNYSISASSNGFYITGSYSGAIDFGGTYQFSNSESEDIYVAKYNHAGILQWAVSTEGNNFSAPFYIKNVDGKVYVAGYIQGEIQFGPETIESAGSEDMLLMILNDDGSLNELLAVGGDDYEHATSVTVDNEGYAAITGTFASLDVDLTEDINLMPGGYSDVPLLIYGPMLETPVLLAPADEETIDDWSPTLDWADVPSALNYGLIVSKDPNFVNDIVLEIDGLTDSEYTFGEDLPFDETYYWKVYAYNRFTEGEYSEAFSFIMVENLEITISIPLIAGWNLVSGRVIPSDDDIETVLDEIIDNIVIVKEGNNIFIPGQIYGITVWNTQKAYRIFSSAATTLDITGLEVAPEEIVLSIPAGWSTIPYLRNTNILAKDAFDSIVDKVVILKGPSGEVYIPELLETMIMSPNKGYSIFLNEATTFSYPAND